MSNISIKGNLAGTGTFTIESPNSNVSRNLILPDASTTLVGTDVEQTLSNKTITGSIIEGGGISGVTALLSGVSFVDINIPAWAKRINLLLIGVSVSGTDLIQIQLGNSSFFETTQYQGMASASFSTTAAQSLNNSFRFYDNAPSAGAVFSGSATLIKGPIIPSPTWVGTGMIGPVIDTSIRFRAFAGHKSMSFGELTRIKFMTSGTDTFDAGTLHVSYEG